MKVDRITLGLYVEGVAGTAISHAKQHQSGEIPVSNCDICMTKRLMVCEKRQNERETHTNLPPVPN